MLEVSHQHLGRREESADMYEPVCDFTKNDTNETEKLSGLFIRCFELFKCSVSKHFTHSSCPYETHEEIKS